MDNHSTYWALALAMGCMRWIKFDFVWDGLDFVIVTLGPTQYGRCFPVHVAHIRAPCLQKNFHFLSCSKTLSSAWMGSVCGFLLVAVEMLRMTMVMMAMVILMVE